MSPIRMRGHGSHPRPLGIQTGRLTDSVMTIYSLLPGHADALGFKWPAHLTPVRPPGTGRSANAPLRTKCAPSANSTRHRCKPPDGLHGAPQPPADLCGWARGLRRMCPSHLAAARTGADFARYTMSQGGSSPSPRGLTPAPARPHPT